MITNNTEAIISLTSHGSRVPYCTNSIFSAIQDCVDLCHVVLTISKSDVKRIDSKLKKLIDLEIVELLIIDRDLGPHTKYYYVMQKYRELPIITIDDDQIYYSNTIPELIRKHKEIPNAVICRLARIIQYKRGLVSPFSEWVKHGFERREGIFNTTHPMGVGGILYPPDVLKITEKNLPEILRYIKADDIYLNALERRNHIPIYCFPNWKARPNLVDEIEYKKPELTRIALREDKNRFRDSDNYVSLLKRDFMNN